MQAPSPATTLNAQHTYTAIVIGTGFAGLGMGLAWRKEGIEDFAILEEVPDVGGVWRDNCTSGTACDVPSHLYSFSFYPNPHGSRKFAPRGEIFADLQDCAARFDLLRHIRFGPLRTRQHPVSRRS